jgi:hypothetical protein
MDVIVPDDPALQPGALAVQARLDALAGEPPEPRTTLRSNLAVFVLVPHVEKAVRAGGVVTVTGTRLFSRGFETVVLLDDAPVPALMTQSETEITFQPPPGLLPGLHAIRVRMNGAESIDSATVRL